MEQKYFLAIDRGQTKIKAALCSTDGTVLEVRSCRCQPIQTPKAGWAQQDMVLIWKQTVLVVQKLLETSGIWPGQVAAVTLSGQGGGNFLVSEEGRPLYPGVLSLDSRHKEIADCMQNLEWIKVPRTVAFMRWLKEKEPKTYYGTRWILGSKDWIRYCLTGVANADLSDPPVPVSLKTGTYQLECLAAAGVLECERMLPPLVYASEICGAVTEEAARETGLLPGTPVAAGAHDMIACSVGTGGNRQGHLTVIMGTLGINIAVAGKDIRLSKDEISDESFLFGGIEKGQQMMTTSIGSCCNTMDWFVERFFSEEKKKAARCGVGFYEYMEDKLPKMAQGGLIFQPYLLGTFYKSAARAGLLGISAETTKEDVLMALYQGICFSMCMEIEKLEQRLQSFDDIWMTGGGSKSRIWGQMFADVLGRPVHICADEESGCRGSALCAGIALGMYTGRNGFPLPKAAVIYYPEQARREYYVKEMELYKKACDISAGLWDVCTELRKNNETGTGGKKIC